MKLVSKYNQLIFPAVLILFLSSILVSYLLIRQVLQNELDGLILRSKSRIENYVVKNNSIPQLNSFDDQIIGFKKSATIPPQPVFSTTTQFIPEQKKQHISRKLVFGLTVTNQPYIVTISQPLEGTRHLTILIAEIALAMIFLVTIVLVTINKKFFRNTWKPFYESLHNIGSFKVNANEKLAFPETEIEEFRIMNEHFALAASNARTEYRNLKEFSENASHEIQTPLAIIRSTLDNLIQQEGLTEKQTGLIQSVYAAVSKLSKIQHVLLLLTKIDNKQFGRQANINLAEKLNSKLNEFNELWAGKKIVCESFITSSVMNINSELLEILLNNLFSNATRHNHAGGRIIIASKQDYLMIANTGEKIPLDSERIFRRFYKGTLKSENNGLGLSIIREICNASGIDVTYNYDKNLHCFTLTWNNAINTHS